MAWVLYIWSGLADSFIFYLPAIFFNCATYFIYIAIQDRELIPVDGGYGFNGRRIIGDGRGIDGIFIALVCGAGAGLITEDVKSAVYLAVGANMGCVCFSLIKRRLNVAQGRKFYPLDSTDFIIGATVLYGTEFPIEPRLVLFGLVGIGLLHCLANIFVRPYLDSYQS